MKIISKKRRRGIIYTLMAVALLCAVFLVTFNTIYNLEEEECYDYLHMQTKQFKDDINNQLKSEKELLYAIANMADELIETNQDLSIVFDSFEPTGLIGNLGVLLPDDTFLSRSDASFFGGTLSYQSEIALGEYISGRLDASSTDENRGIIRIAVPIGGADSQKGIVYGTIDLDELNKRYMEAVSELDAQLYVFESNSGRLIIDTVNTSLGSIEVLEDVDFEEDYSYEMLRSTPNGYSVFQSAIWHEKVYMHYSTLDDADWKIALVRRQTHVFERANESANILYASFFAILIVVGIYFFFLLVREKRKKRTTHEASQIRKLLLDATNSEENIKLSLKKISEYVRSRSAIIADTDTTDMGYISPLGGYSIPNGEARKYFISEIFGYAAEYNTGGDRSINVISIKACSALDKTNKKFGEFLRKHKIKEVLFAAITTQTNHIGVLGVVNPKKPDLARDLLEDIAVCFSIAIYNKKHLSQTEKAAVTDALTGVANRVAYKKDIITMDEEKWENVACVYIDVNELHIRNNRYGHASGDEMLVYIANTLKEVFYGNYVYRMGGDEFLVFVKNTSPEDVKLATETMTRRLVPMNYHVAMGMSFRAQNTSVEEMVTEAERRMYEAKSDYYQNKEVQAISLSNASDVMISKTGIEEIDTLLGIMRERYNGIYRVSLKSDEAHRILMPSYLGYNENEDSFKRIFTKYVQEEIDGDFHRALLNFMNYDVIKHQLSEGKVPSITYKKNNGEVVLLKVYSFAAPGRSIDNTLWVFEKV